MQLTSITMKQLFSQLFILRVTYSWRDTVTMWPMMKFWEGDVTTSVRYSESQQIELCGTRTYYAYQRKGRQVWPWTGNLSLVDISKNKEDHSPQKTWWAILNENLQAVGVIGEEQRELSVTAAGGRNWSPSVRAQRDGRMDYTRKSIVSLRYTHMS